MVKDDYATQIVLFNARVDSAIAIAEQGGILTSVEIVQELRHIADDLEKEKSGTSAKSRT